MRSSRSAPDPLDPGAQGFAHRGLHHGAGFPENSLVAFAAALEAGAGIECDLRLTSDNRIIVFHDADCRRMCASPLQVGASTLEQLRRLKVGDHSIPTLEALLTLVDGRVPLLLEIKVANDLWRWMPAVKELLGQYPGPFAVMSFDPRIPRLFKTNMPSVRRGLLIPADLSPVRRRLYHWLAAPDFIAVEFAAIARSWVARLRLRLPVYCWTIQTADHRSQAEVHADALIWEGNGRPRN